MISQTELALITALGRYADAVRFSESAKQHGTHGDGRVAAAFRAETAAYRAVLAVGAPNALEAILTDEIIQTAHYRATEVAKGISVVNGLHALVQSAVQS